METMSSYGASINRPLCEIAGLSTDTKPIEKVEGIRIQNGSKFREIDTGHTYLFDGESKTWNKASSGGGGGGGSATLIEKSIIANGTYTASDDNADGYSEVTVGVTAIGMPKLATPTAVASAVENYNKQYIYTNASTFKCTGSMFGVENAPPQFTSKIINIFTYRPTVITIPYYNSYNDTLDLLFMAGNSFAVKYYPNEADTSTTTVSLSQNFENGKVYRVKLQISYITNRLNISQKSITEYNEPIKFTVT